MKYHDTAWRAYSVIATPLRLEVSPPVLGEAALTRAMCSACGAVSDPYGMEGMINDAALRNA